MIACQVRDVRLVRGAFVLHVPGCRLEGGRIYAVVGPNGSGKTTFLDLLALLERPLQGHVALAGGAVDWGDAAGLVRARRRTAYLMQNPYLFRSTVFDNIAYPLRLRGVPRAVIRARVAAVAGRLSLEGLLARRPHELSGGEVQRVALARALVLDAPLLLLDEPTASVDRQHVELVEGLLRWTCRERGACVVFTTHSAHQAGRLSGDLIPVADGCVGTSQGNQGGEPGAWCAAT
ncbi:MAG: ATP-binding cassette domain-containing protein [Candidatus Latescibacterota bacterium]